ncbi:ABC transporter permease [Candidatus Bathyarchaeota archaeon]|nr:ABC transporter permease [Candidatus Bathyarchaeota archaeon]MBS7613253.1 ABC transporter permease [Candidatus Bathyarchaeota archaeon]MBS7618111.1 ABC transporter permease [Candidatus Bathyarchaeota archaeon]
MKVEELIKLFKDDKPRLSSEVIHVWAVFWANFKIFLSYRTWVIMETISTVASIAMYSFMGLQVDATRVVLAGYGEVDWLSFALVGVATANYLWMCVSRLSHSLQHEIREGTLEPIITSLISMRSYIIGQSIRGFLVSGYFMLGVIVVGIGVLRTPLIINLETILSFIAVILLMVLSYAGIGIMAAGLILVYKKGDPLTFLFASVTEFLGGVLFPLKYLENFPILYVMAWLMPYTYALDAARRILLNGATLLSPNVLLNVTVLIVYTVIFIPLGLKVFKWGINRIRHEGTVATY